VVKEGGEEEEETQPPEVMKKLKTNSNSAKPTKLRNKEHTDQANSINNNGNSELESSSDFPSKRKRKQSKKAAEAAEAQSLHLSSQPVLELPSIPAETEPRQDAIWGDDWPVSEQEGSRG